MDPQYLSALEETLKQTFDPATVKSATSKLSKDLYSNPLALPSLLHILQNAQQDQLKQLAAVESRKLVFTKWETVDASLKPQIREALLQNTFRQPTKMIRHSSARVISAIAEFDLQENDWPELLPALIQAVQGSDVQVKETAVFTLYTLLETQAPAVNAHKDDFLTLFSGLLTDPSQEVRVNAVLCLDCLSQAIEEDEENDALASKFKASIPGITNVLKDVIQADDSEKIKACFDVLNNLIFLDNKLVGDQIFGLIELVSELALNTSADEEYRCMAMQFLISVASFRKTKIAASNLGPRFTAIATRVAGEEVDLEDELNNEDEENENEENEPATLALRLIGVLSTELPPSQVIAPLFESLNSMVQSANPFVRRGGLLCIGVASAGAPDYYNTHVHKIVPVLLNGMQDPEVAVKVAAVRSLSQLASELQDNIADYHAQLLPLLMGIIDSASHVMTYKYACFALDGIIEFMSHDDVTVYMAPLMQKLFSMLENAHSSSLKSAIVSAIGSAAFAGGKSFIPYFNDSIRALEPLISNVAETEGVSEKDIELRAITFENISTMARAVGTEPFAPYATPLVEAAYSSIASDSPRIRESGFAFISNMAKVYGSEFAGVLDEIVPKILMCLEQEEFSFGTGEEDDEFGEEDEEGFGNNFKFNTGITIEKEMACAALAELAIGTGAAFARFVEPSLKTLAEQSEISYGMREAAMNTLWKIVHAMFKATYGDKFKAPKGVPQQPYVDASILQLIEQVRAITVSNLEDEIEFGLVACDLETLTEAISSFGIIALVSDASKTDSLEKLCVQLMSILKNEHACQIDGEEPVVDGEDSSESDSMLYETALEVLIALSLELGSEFIKIFNSFKDVIIASVTSKSKNKRVSSIGALAEISVGLKDSNPYVQDLLQVFSDRLANDVSLEVKGNAAYGVGILIEHSTADFSGNYQQILETMFHLMNRADAEAKNEDGESVEVVNRANANACGCVSRMALKNESAIPVGHVLPVLLDHLPLEAGPEENVPILTWIIKLYENNNTVINTHTERVISILAELFKKEADRVKVLEQSTLGREEALEKMKQFNNDELKTKVVNLLKFLSQKYPNVVASHEVLKSVVA